MAYTKLKVTNSVLKKGVHYLTSDYKTRNPKRKTHDGMDIIGSGYATDYIVAIEDGTILATGYNVFRGYYVKVKHENGYYSIYQHMKKNSIAVKKNQKVKKGATLGYMGSTGDSTGAHLHFGVNNGKSWVDPLPYLQGTKNFKKTAYEYQSYDLKKKKWLPKVNTGTSEYAGNFDNNLGGLKIEGLDFRVHVLGAKKYLDWNEVGDLKKPIDGIQIKGARYRVHLTGLGWLKYVDKVDSTANGYAGILGQEIDAVQIEVK